MIEHYCRPNLQRYCIEPLTQQLRQWHWLTPNIVSIAAGITGVIAAFCAALQLPWFAIVTLLLSGLLDIIDGSLARTANQQSNFGCVLDIMMDRLVEASMIIGLFLVDSTQRGLSCLIVFSSILLCITSFLVVGIFTELENQSPNKSFHYSPGLMERAEAFAFFIAMLLIPSWFNVLAWLFSGLVVLTAIIRLYQFKQHQDSIHVTD